VLHAAMLDTHTRAQKILLIYLFVIDLSFEAHNTQRSISGVPTKSASTFKVPQRAGGAGSPLAPSGERGNMYRNATNSNGVRNPSCLYN